MKNKITYSELKKISRDNCIQFNNSFLYAILNKYDNNYVLYYDTQSDFQLRKCFIRGIYNCNDNILISFTWNCGDMDMRKDIIISSDMLFHFQRLNLISFSFPQNQIV